MKKIFLVICVFFLLVISTLGPLSFGYKLSEKDTIPESYGHDRFLYPEYYDCYNTSEIGYGPIPRYNNNDFIDSESEKTNIVKETPGPLNGPPMDSPWPMYCHDTRHTGRSPYNTVDTWNEVWMFETWGPVQGGSVIAEDGTIYTGAYPLYAIYPNGTLKWMFELDGWIVSCPATDDNGTIYVGDRHGYFYAINSDGTEKWSYRVGNDIFSSPAIGDDGSIYFGNVIYPTDGYIYALYPNGTLKWTYKTGHVVYSSPAIGEDGTVYCGSHDTYLYALYPNNGTLKWKYKTGDWIRTSPCIGDDGTIYVVSLDGYLHAVNPDSTLKWKTDVGAGTSPTIGQDGTIYAGYSTLYALNPSDGSVKWAFPVGGTMRGGTPCNSIDGTIFVGTSDGGEILAINPDGTLKWRKSIGTCESAPAIGEDGVVYIGSSYEYFYAFGIGPLEADANGPYYGLINQPVQFIGSASGGYSPYTSWYWSFGDGNSSDEQNPTHTYPEAGNYTVTLTVTDNTSNSSSNITWTQVQATNEPPEKPIIDGVKIGEPHFNYDYTFVSTDPEENTIFYYIDWDDNTNSGWLGPYDSGQQIILTHTWNEAKLYHIHAKTKDIFDAESKWSTFGVIIPRNRATISSLFLRFLERFQMLERLLFLLK
jgi:outer membrane protein assembly factor BamB